MDKLLAQFCAPFRSVIGPYQKELEVSREIRIRTGQKILLRGAADVIIPSFCPDKRAMEDLLLSFCQRALYAHEEQIRQGYLTLPGGHRAGICGKMILKDGNPVRLSGIQSINVRIARQVPCEARAVEIVYRNGALRSVLIVSEPGMGKTTMLRELARQLSRDGIQVAIADERGELAAGREGIPQLDVGPNTDVMDGIPKSCAIKMLLRSMTPQIIVTDEIGGEEDADAIMEAQRSGVRVLCSAHGASYLDVKRRSAMRRLMQDGAFERVILLGHEVGHILAVYDGEGRPC